MSTVDAAIYLATRGVRRGTGASAGADQAGPEMYWIRPYFGKLVDPPKSLIIQENLVNEIISYEPMLIPGMHQIEEYVRAGFRDTEYSPSKVESLVTARLGGKPCFAAATRRSASSSSTSAP